MRSTYILLILGILIAVLPYLGLPGVWKNIFFTLAGLGLALFSYLVHRETRMRKREETPDNFSENHYFRERSQIDSI